MCYQELKIPKFYIKAWVWGLREKDTVTIWQHSHMALTGHATRHLPIPAPGHLAPEQMCCWVFGFISCLI